MSAKPRYPWQKIKAEFVETDSALADLSKKYGVSYSHLWKRADTENWQDDRQRFRDELEATRRAAQMEQCKEITANWKSGGLLLLQKFRQKMEKAMDRDVDARELELLSRTAERIEAIGASLIGEPAQAGAVDQQKLSEYESLPAEQLVILYQSLIKG